MTARHAYEHYVATSGASQWLSWEAWQTAYAAGMERAAEIASEAWYRNGATVADAIRAEIKDQS